jgi:hypothetical protein
MLVILATQEAEIGRDGCQQKEVIHFNRQTGHADMCLAFQVGGSLSEAGPGEKLKPPFEKQLKQKGMKGGKGVSRGRAPA